MSLKPATIQKQTGDSIILMVEVADTEAKRERGLMYRLSLPENQGMLFKFSNVTRSSFWMKDTPLPLDILFIRDGEIVDIIEGTTPFSEELLIPERNYTEAIEVNAGFVSANHVIEGDHVALP